MFKTKWLKYFLLLVLLIPAYFAQQYVSEKFKIDSNKNLIQTAYIINLIIVLLFFLFIDLFKEKYKDLIGFAFMASSLLKFTAFFIFMYPTYKQDGHLSKEEMITFFIPYTICLIYETRIVSKILNNLKF